MEKVIKNVLHKLLPKWKENKLCALLYKTFIGCLSGGSEEAGEKE